MFYKIKLKFLKIFFQIIIFTIANSSTAEDSLKFNGYDIKQFGDFAKDWHFVTVRFRNDSNEMRIVYANDLAWKALNENSNKYPNGSVFAKIGIQTIPDPSFTSSLVPAGSRRVQFMVKNEVLHKNTNGWGYALFDSNGIPYPGDQQSQTQACAACHQIVNDRNNVFSQLMFYKSAKVFADENWKKYLTFEETNTVNLHSKLKKNVSEKSVRYLKGHLQTNVFNGTLDEIRPLLISEAKKTKKTAVFSSIDGNYFTIVIPKNSNKSCVGENVASMTIIQSNKIIQNKYVEESICVYN
jgi:hypothetical protein